MASKAYLLGCAIIAALGGLLFGFDTAVINGAEGQIQEQFGLSDLWHGLTVSSALAGTIIGALLIGRPSDAIGRRPALMLLAVLYLVSAVGSAVAWDWYSLIFFRFIGGLGVGGASVVSPMYLSEISPARVRGRLVAVNQLNIVIGILAAFFSNYLIGTLGMGETEWRWMLGVEAVPAALFLGLLKLAPESPRWLVANGRFDEARRGLDRLGTDTGDVDSEIEEIRRSLAGQEHGIHEPLFQAKYLKPILMAVAIAAFNQLSGINAVMYYSARIFQMAGAGEDAALLQTVLLGGVNLVVTIVAMAMIDRFGRRKLMLAGSIGYIVSLGIVAGTFYTFGSEFNQVGSALARIEEAKEAGDKEALTTAKRKLSEATAAARTGGAVVLTGLIVFIASHAFGQGAVIWVFISEIFPNRVRARGQSIGVFTHWFMNFAIQSVFPMIAETSGGHPFAFFCVMMVLQLLWVLLIMPETKGVPLEKIHKKLGIHDAD